MKGRSPVTIPVPPLRERAILVGLATPRIPRAKAEEYLDELALLADSAGADVVARVLQERPAIDAAFFIGKGKAEEIAWMVEERDVTLVLFDDDLSSVQARNLERIINRKILDRSGLILDIFASRARTSEARTQVEVAQLQYMLSRLTRQWTHLSKQYGGIGTKGPGETQIETDRRMIRTRISHLTERLRRIARERRVQRKGRENFPRLAFVGYTNAGKSTLLNTLSNAGVAVEDKLFATLDSTVRLVALSPTHRILMTDTVGFIRKLPHHLVASFKSTLDEVREADILLHVVDCSHPALEEQIQVVQETLEEIGVHDKTTLMIFNKIDRVQNRAILSYLGREHKNSVFVSATRGINLSGLRDSLLHLLESEIVENTLTVSHGDYAMIARMYDRAEVLDKHFDAEGVTIRFRMHRVTMERLRRLLAQRAGIEAWAVSSPETGSPRERGARRRKPR
jgi:GTP-binding protein HflX